MKKLILSALAVSVLITAFIAVNVLTTKQKSNDGAEEVKNTFSSTENDQTYTVKEYLDRIGIFKDGENKPDIVLDVYVFTLPESDRKMLKDGFVISKDVLMNTIEDYTG